VNGGSAARRVLYVVACLMGAAGVAASAAAAHAGSTLMQPAALLLLVHAAAMLALGASVGHTALGLVAMAGLAAASLLFAGDMAMRTWAGTPLFAMAAPVGGSTAILAWLLAALAVAVGRPR
jgi:uncharacterized membrane protein YgdD (TMEM256/DUF423 family)